jgi:hypothetical protein
VPTALKRKRNHIFDIDALSVAVPYCDAVVADGDAIDKLRRSRVAERLDTPIFPSLADLVAHLSKKSGARGKGDAVSPRRLRSSISQPFQRRRRRSQSGARCADSLGELLVAERGDSVGDPVLGVVKNRDRVIRNPLVLGTDENRSRDEEPPHERLCFDVES